MASVAGAGPSGAMGAVRAERFTSVVQRFLEAAAVPELWPNALDALAEACGACGAIALPVCGIDPLPQIPSARVAALWGEIKDSGWYAPDRNSRMQRSMALVQRGWRGIITEQHAYTPEELARDPFHQEFLTPLGLGSYAGAVIAQAPGLALPISIEREVRQGSFQAGEVKLMNQLFTHLHAAGEVAVHIGMAATSRMADAMGATGQPAALLGRDGRIVHMNARFELLLGDGLSVRAGRLSAAQPEAERALAAAIDQAVRYDGTMREPFTAVVLPRRGSLRPLVAHVVPVVGLGHDILHLMAAIVTLTDLEVADAPPAAALLEQAFGLTPAEARLAAKLAAGATLPAISRSEKVSRETLRSRLKAIFDKTGTSRQAELALLLSRIAGPAR
jgi:DNA-binding CsgD family transcriptional regulator/PAS domain-containing protein